MRSIADTAVKRNDSIGRDEDVGRLAQPSCRKRRRLEVAARDENNVGIPIELKVLEAIVQNVDGGAEMMLREPSRQVAIR